MRFVGQYFFAGGQLGSLAGPYCSFNMSTLHTYLLFDLGLSISPTSPITSVNSDFTRTRTTRHYTHRFGFSSLACSRAWEGERSQFTGPILFMFTWTRHPHQSHSLNAVGSHMRPVNRDSHSEECGPDKHALCIRNVERERASAATTLAKGPRKKKKKNCMHKHRSEALMQHPNVRRNCSIQKLSAILSRTRLVCTWCRSTLSHPSAFRPHH